MDVRRVIGENVRRIRLAADMSQEAVAEAMGVDRAYISSLELGQRNITVISLWRVAEALGVEPHALLLATPTAQAGKKRPTRK
jgi:transcriptional regulator with XRE-family HTH domain